MSERRNPHVLLCSGWQTVNIGDVAHSAGMLALLEREIPEARVTLWPFKPLTEEFIAILRARFPSLRILPSTADPAQPIDDPEILAAMDDADFCLHNSGPATLAWKHCEAFAKRTNRAFGIYGVSYGLYGIPERKTLDRAAFVFFRDSLSLANARKDGVSTEVMGLALDSAFATDLRDDAPAAAFLQKHDLKPGEFLCCISRLRNTPFWEMPGYGAPVDPEKYTANFTSSDLLTKPIREAIVRVIRSTNLKILLCPEDWTHVRISREYIYDRLPDDVKTRVVWRDCFWQPGEAISVYAKSAGLFGSDMHSPIFCIGHGIPAIVARWKEQSTKGLMWRDIGLGNWLFDFDVGAERLQFVDEVERLATDLPAASTAAKDAQVRVRASQKSSMAVFRAILQTGRR